MIHFDEAKMASIIEDAVEKCLNRTLPNALQHASNQEWLTTSDVMNLLNCSRRQVQYLRDSNQIPFLKINRMIRYNRQEIEDYIKSKICSLSTNNNHNLPF